MAVFAEDDAQSLHTRRADQALGLGEVDRMFGVAEKYRLPLVLYTEGCGGRTGGAMRPGEVGRAASTVGNLSVRNWCELVQTRRRLVMGLESAPRKPARTGKKRAWVDSW